MSEFVPTNDLDRAVMAMARSKEGLPELIRRLGEGELFFLMPAHPEIEAGDELKLENGMPVPCSILKDKEGEIVPIYSSPERGVEGLTKGGALKGNYAIAGMEAKLLLQIIGNLNVRAVLNKGCSTGQLVLPVNLLRDIASGEALTPNDISAPENQSGSLTILNPADYPTHMVQPLFEVMRKHSQFHAAWIFENREAERLPGGGKRYQVLVLMLPRDPTVFHDFNLVLQSACRKGDEVGAGFLNGMEATALFRQAPAFYVASDYKLPRGAKV